ncbi:hypothetical protein GWK47_040490 [Chionoecetes opilio]|uniref:Uncharacterized protein n=1 Tax=Chionoecetes opilio TaxID=41210 RepID=A0A8J5CXB9_CHIOP|nr:hypothetical protein GWK47_040490 [Chionoecetes opilio]
MMKSYDSEVSVAHATLQRKESHGIDVFEGFQKANSKVGWTPDKTVLIMRQFGRSRAGRRLAAALNCVSAMISYFFASAPFQLCQPSIGYRDLVQFQCPPSNVNFDKHSKVEVNR